MEIQPLTARQKEILDYLEGFTADCGYPPTVREVCAATGLKSPRSVSQHLQALERKGYIKRGRDKSRAIKFLHKTGRTGADLIELQLVGSVAAGEPVTTTQTSQTTYEVDRRLVDGDKSFIMEVAGTSMIDAHIIAGDYIVVDPEPRTINGDIVVAQIGSETTVKRYESNGQGDFLVPENSGMDRIDLSAQNGDVRILGKVVGLIRRMN